MKVMVSCCLAIGVLGAAAVPAKAATYYVSQSGNDANSCTTAQSTGQTSQKQTISAGVACLLAGDTLYIHGGTYTGTINSINSGATTVRGGTSWTAAITVAAFPGETVVIAVGSSSTGNAITLTSATQTYLIFDHLILDGTGMDTWGGGLYHGPGASHVRFQNGEIRNFGGMGVNSSHVAGPDLQILYNHIHHNGHNASPQTHNIYLTSSDNLIEGNEVDHSAYLGITVYDAGGANRNIIRKNKVHDNCIYGASEIGVSGESNLVYDNLIYGSSQGASIEVAYAAPSGSLVYNNTVAASPGGITIGADASNTIVKNNVVWRTAYGATGLITDQGVGSTISSNLTTNPLFSNAAANDFRLQSGSPARDAGVVLVEVPDDINGKPRGQGNAYDIGAYEYGIAPPTNVLVSP
jgi:parallel beta-helix repeat protein